MPLYFPRSGEEEAYATKALPLDLGDEFGEPIIQERKIKISANPLVKGVFCACEESVGVAAGCRVQNAWKGCSLRNTGQSYL